MIFIDLRQDSEIEFLIEIKTRPMMARSILCSMDYTVV